MKKIIIIVIEIVNICKTSETANGSYIYIYMYIYILYIYIYIYQAKCCIGRSVHIRLPTGDRQLCIIGTLSVI